MSKSITEIARHPARYGALLALAVLALVLGVMKASAYTTPSGFMENGAFGGDGDVRDTVSSPNPPFDWANSGAASPDVACTSLTGYSAVSGFTNQHVSGAGGLFDCGQGDGQFTTPIAPVQTADGTVGAHHIDAIAFKVDPLSSDKNTCGVPQTQNGDPTTFTKTGGEKNGDSLVVDSTGGNAVETWSQASVPPKDDLTNIYAVSRSGFDDSTLANAVNDALSGTGKELFFGAERVVNSGDTHLDFEFLQAPIALTDAAGNPGEPPAVCAGEFTGHRTQGDFIASIDYTTGGSLGTFSLAQWHCNLDTHSADNGSGWITDPTANPGTGTVGTPGVNGTVCDFAAGTGASAGSGVQLGTGPHYQEVACVDTNGFAIKPNCPGASASDVNTVCDKTKLPSGQTDCAPGIPAGAIQAVTNGGGPVPCGGWACRLSTGTTPTGPIGTCTASSCIDTNELMEGGVNLKAIGFTGCINTALPHTRSAQSFTATTKDFELIKFVTCKTAFSWEKVDEQGNRLSGAEFTVSPNPHTNTPASSITVTDCTASPCTGLEDKDPTVGRFCVQGVVSGTYTVHESVVPSGFIGAADQMVTKSTVGLTNNVNCPVSPVTVTFTNVLGSLQWEKRSDIDGSLQDGATFQVTPDPTLAGGNSCPTNGPISNCLELTDCTAIACSGADKDPDAGQFTLPSVKVGSSSGTPTAITYTITEVGAKSGFAIDPDPDRTCTVGATLATRDCVVGTRVAGTIATPGELGAGRPTQPDPPNDVADDCPDRTPDDTTTGDHNGVSGATNPAPPASPGDDFCNPVGSLAWEKHAKDASVGGTPLLAGATFTVGDGTTTRTVADCVTAPNPCPAGSVDRDPAGGKFCVDQVVLNTTITVTETKAPDHYVLDSTPKTTTLTSSSTCAGTPTKLSTDFINTPLSEFRIQFVCLVPGANGGCATAAQFSCDVAANPENGAGDTALTITSNTAASPTVVTTSAPHGLTTGAVVHITGSNSTPSIDGTFPVTVIDATHFSIPVNVTAAGTAGSVLPLDDTNELYGDGTTTLTPGSHNCTIVIDP